MTLKEDILTQVELARCTTPQTGFARSTLEDPGVRPCVRGKFIFVGDDKLYIRGVTYGPFRPDEAGSEYHRPEDVDRDFALMAANGINAVRTYTVPPRWLLDMAKHHGLRVMVGIPWEQHITFLDDRQRVNEIVEKVRAGVRACAGHPALLCYAIGNEIPAPIVRWYGARRVERFLRRLYSAAKAEDPAGLVTYVNYPTTEYLRLPFLDFVCFNVYLESRETLEPYLARVQNIAGDRPLVMAEIGLDSRRNGEEAQARVLDWQVRTPFAAGAAGIFVFSWTDEWHRGGYDIEDWDFGLTTRDRGPKPALEAVRRAFAEVPFPPDLAWPRISVIVCSHDGERTIRDCCEGLRRLEYPDFEVIMVDDGSTDATAAIAREYDFRVISTEAGGLSRARNAGLEAATGAIVAYTDDDAIPDRHWLTYLAATFLAGDYAGVGGPNIPPPGDGPIADCVANAPGGPIHVLISDREAEHIPGCNMAFRRDCLQAIGGFDPRFRSAGDDVDVCWELLQRGWSIGFSPAAMVWHHRRNSVRTYWRQQKGYGRAEALLEFKWPGKYNAFGHVAWKGQLYGRGLTPALILRRWRVYHGVWGTGLFQSLYQRSPGTLLALPLTPEWYLLIAGLAVLSLLGTLWDHLFWFLPLLAIAAALPLAQAILGAAWAAYPPASRGRVERLALRGLTAVLYLLQPMARLWGRLRHGLTPWRRRGVPAFAFPWPRTTWFWSETWQAPEQRLESLEAALCDQGAVIMRGSDFDRWDLDVRGGMFSGVRARLVIEEHGGGRQRFGLRSWPHWMLLGFIPAALLAILAIAAGADLARMTASLLGLAALLLGLHTFSDCAAATATWLHVLDRMPGRIDSNRQRRPSASQGEH